MTVTVITGNPKPQSRTRLAAHRVATALTGAEPELDLDLADFGAGLLDWNDPAVAEAVEQVQASELLIVASPTYKGTYTGLLKLFLDRFGAGSLAGVRAVPLMLGGHWRHALAPEVFLKPVLNEIGASTPTAGLYLLDSEWEAPDALDAWLAIAAQQLSVTVRP
ncbi:NAD(P)H-dependent oxidoreductase [Jatrophihabitans sp.]|uniref:NADPH-dependent FMN reductase n=1 Tax=Jatrophihabitans sp. TaxID=1932789 RepID=UPI0030C6BA87|nr:NADPH-dependent fmn reductase [Jatrophihabitans sp.]